MAKQYSKEYKAEAIKMVPEGKKGQRRVADELGLAPSTLSTWLRRYRADSERGIEGSQVLSATDLELRSPEEEQGT